MKKIKTTLKLNLPAGAATAAPPVGPALGAQGLNILEFIRVYNEKTADKKGSIVPVVITVYEDRTFSFVTKTPPASNLIKKTIGIEKGSGIASRKKVGTITREQLRSIAQVKMEDLNAKDLEAAEKIIEGTAKNMGVEIIEQ